MRLLQPYKQLNKLKLKESFEPRLRWAVRMAISAMVPLIWGIYTDRLEEAGWIALAAECICWVELKGDFQQRLMLLAGGAALAIIFSILGTLAAGSIWFSILLVAFTGFITSLLKSVGSRGMSLALCVYALFIFCNAFPVEGERALAERTVLIAIGAVWNSVAAIAVSLFTPAQEPYRRTIAKIWNSIADLTHQLSLGWEGKGPRSNEHLIYLKEKEIRTALDESLEIFDKMVHESTEKEGHTYNLAHVRKAAAIVGAQMLTISEELSTISIYRLDSHISVKVFTILRALEQTLERMAIYTISKDGEEEIILQSRLYRLSKLTEILKDKIANDEFPEKETLLRFIQIAERNTGVLSSAFKNLTDLSGEQTMGRSYPFMKTFYILHPKYWWQYIRLLVDFNTYTAKYALRTAIAAAFAMFIYKWWDIDHGYWIPFTLLIVMQTHFGATFTKARDRVIGTVAGGIAGGLLLRIPSAGIYIQEFILFLTFIPMIVLMKKHYAWAVFFITLNLVLLFNINREISSMLILIRALSTIGGAAIAVFAGFALMPMWDKRHLPLHLADAVYKNYVYFITTLYPNSNPTNSWTKEKRMAESGNSNVFDSFTRYMQEPGFRKRPYAIFYYIITHNIRITRELNNIQLEVQNNTDEEIDIKPEEYDIRIKKCREWFEKDVKILRQLRIDKKDIYPIIDVKQNPTEAYTKNQLIYIEKMLVELKAMNKDLQVLAEKLPRIMRL